MSPLNPLHGQSRLNSMSGNSAPTRVTKYIDVTFNIIQQFTQNGVINATYIPTASIIAYSFNKALPRHRYMQQSLCMRVFCYFEPTYVQCSRLIRRGRESTSCRAVIFTVPYNVSVERFHYWQRGLLFHLLFPSS